jgi:hypothetical protein
MKCKTPLACTKPGTLRPLSALMSDQYRLLYRPDPDQHDAGQPPPCWPSLMATYGRLG